MPKNKQGQSPQEKRFFRKQASRGNTFFDFLRSKTKVLLPFIIAPAIYFANPNQAKAEFYVSGGYEWNLLPSTQNYTTDLTSKLRDGTITQEPTSNVTDVNPASSLGMTNIEAGYGIKLNKDLILWLKGGYSWGKTNTSYSTIGKGNVSGDNLPITRTEENNFGNWKIGAKLEKDFKNFAIGAGAWLDFLNANHKSSLEWDAIASGQTNPYYKQWRDYSASGIGIGASIEGSLAWQPFNWLSISGILGYNFGKVDMSGEQLLKSTSNPTWRDNGTYNLTFNVDCLSAKAKVEIKI